MLVLLAGIFVIHIATVIMLFVSTISNVSNSASEQNCQALNSVLP